MIGHLTLRNSPSFRVPQRTDPVSRVPSDFEVIEHGCEEDLARSVRDRACRRGVLRRRLESPESLAVDRGAPEPVAIVDRDGHHVGGGTDRDADLIVHVDRDIDVDVHIYRDVDRHEDLDVHVN